MSSHMTIQPFLEALGAEIKNPEEEAFFLFSQPIPSQNLGFIDSKATTLELEISGKDLTIHQSPTILSSNRRGGTTGAVLWKITPLFASWVSSCANPLFRHSILGRESNVIELGCGISGIIGLTLRALVNSYVLTDQDYVMKLLNRNLSENAPSANKKKSMSKGSSASTESPVAKTLDWEADQVSLQEWGSFDALIACDCIYNDALIQPLVQTCVDVCELRSKEERHTVCIVAQQLRSAEVFENWLKTFSDKFRTWKVPDEMLDDGLKDGQGFAVHIGVLRS